MIKKLYILLLFSLKLASSDSDPYNCLTCHVFGFSTINAANLSTSACLKASILASAATAYKAGECCHRQCVYNFDSNNCADTTCAKVSGIVTAKYCLGCAIYGQCPTCLPTLCLLLIHNVSKIAEESITDSF